MIEALLATIRNILSEKKNLYILIRPMNIEDSATKCIYCLNDYKKAELEQCLQCKLTEETLVIFVVTIQKEDLERFFLLISTYALKLHLEIFIKMIYNSKVRGKDNPFMLYQKKIQNSKLFSAMEAFLEHLKRQNPSKKISYIIFPHTIR